MAAKLLTLQKNNMRHYYKNTVLLISLIFALPAFAYVDPSAVTNTDISNEADKGELSGFQLPPVDMEDQPLPLESTTDYPAGAQMPQPVQQPQAVYAPNQAPIVSNQAALNVHLQLNFTQTMDDSVVLMYQYYYIDTRQVPWTGEMTFANNNNDQSVQLQRAPAVNSMLLFLRPSGAGSAQCITTDGDPTIPNNVTSVQVIGTTDADGNYFCQLIIG